MRPARARTGIEDRLPAWVLVPLLITSFVLAVLVRAAAFYLERVESGRA